MWHVSSRSGVATLRTATHLLLTYLLTFTTIAGIPSFPIVRFREAHTPPAPLHPLRLRTSATRWDIYCNRRHIFVPYTHALAPRLQPTRPRYDTVSIYKRLIHDHAHRRSFRGRGGLSPKPDLVPIWSPATKHTWAIENASSDYIFGSSM